jgi:porphobilinogen synthase
MMPRFPELRFRRLRTSVALRALVSENQINVGDLIYPLFITEGTGVKREVDSMPGGFNLSVDELDKEIAEVFSLKIPAVLLFGVVNDKDDTGSASCDPKGVVQQAIHVIKKAAPEMLVITDVCLCEYTSHGHCGVIIDGQVDNDKTLPFLSKMALSHARAGADIIAPSDMMDGRVGSIRSALDANGFPNTPIMAYAAKYASAFFGPFREAAGSTPQFGDRKSYQMDPSNLREALREIEEDIEEGADIVMVKPALPYLDVIRSVRDKFSYPLAAYNVSGEYAMVKAAAAQGWIDEERVVMEIMNGIKRAGADIVITYHAKDVARWLSSRGS